MTAMQLPWDYTTKTAIELTPWPHVRVRKVNQRVRDLQSIAPALAAHISQFPTVPELKALIRGLEAIAAAEARRAKRQSWAYDLPRHTAIRRALAWEKALLVKLQELEREVA